MLRKDGTFTFYKIQHQQTDGEWVYSIYGTPDTNSKAKPCPDTFTASGRCWQETGEHGVYDKRNALVGLKNARANVRKAVSNGNLPKPYKLRLVKVTVKQTTTPC